MNYYLQIHFGKKNTKQYWNKLSIVAIGAYAINGDMKFDDDDDDPLSNNS